MNIAFTLLAASSILAADPTPRVVEVKPPPPSDITIEAPPVENSGPGGRAELSKSKRKPSSQPTRGKVAITQESKAFSFTRDRGSRPLVVRSGDNNPKATLQLQEDLAVMARILEKSTLEFREEREEAAGIPILALGGARSVRAMYLEDYGAVFTMTVAIPLRLDPKVQEPEEKADKVTNEEWNEARNELFGDRRQARPEKVSKREFDPHQFEEFRDSLLEALRNGANIRNLRPTDWITLVVRGRNLDEDDRRFDLFLQSGSGRDAIVTPFPSGEERTEVSTMVLRVRRSELDGLPKDPHNLDELRKKVSLSLY